MKNVFMQINYKKIFGEIISYEKELYIRRVQVNKMCQDSFIGYHLDVDSNPDYLAAVVIQIGAEFEGGDYVVYKNKEEHQYLKHLKNILDTGNFRENRTGVNSYSLFCPPQLRFNLRNNHFLEDIQILFRT